MGNREPSPGNPGEELSEESSPLDDAREAALIRKVLRVQERHREGGVEPEPEVDDGDPGLDA